MLLTKENLGQNWGCQIMGAAIARHVITVLTASSLFVAQPALAIPASEYRALGLSYRAAAKYPQAIAALQKSVELEPQNLSGRILLGWTQHLAGQKEAAAESLIQVLYRAPNSIPALNALGIVYLVGGKLNAAVFVHTWAAILQPKNEIAYYNLSLAFERLQSYEPAIGAAKRAAQLEPTNPHPLVALSLAHWQKGDRAAAQAAYRQAYNLDGRYRDRVFLNHLQQAGFSQQQIEMTKQILAATLG
ncbi:tetratricopeptide repeat protein [Chroococcidiopsis sp.]|uniref:tetratricopeptide repeat protein n=1 Tax=Chroococcidiopsis sp. TaxID=3088168 RepID=UPI003F317A50